MTTRWKSFLGAGLALAFSVGAAVQSGCVVVAAGAAAGAGSVAYVRGELEAAIVSRHAKVVEATSRAIDQLKFVRISEERDLIPASFIVRTADDKRVHIVITEESNTLTKLKIRVGVLGDEELSQTILDRIKANL